MPVRTSSSYTPFSLESSRTGSGEESAWHGGHVLAAKVAAQRSRDAGPPEHAVPKLLAVYAIIYEELKRRAFGGDFRRFRAWLDSQSRLHGATG